MGNEMKKFKIERTKTNLPARWEHGGGNTNTGEAYIIAGANGQPKRPVYIRRSGHLANDRHALIVVEKGDYIIWTWHKRRDFLIRIFKIVDFENDYAITEIVSEFTKGQWNSPLPEYLQSAVTAAMEKATCYHCRSAHYII